MKNLLKYILLASLCLILWSCKEKALSDETIFKNPNKTETDFDKWLYNHYTAPYNIRFIYEMDHYESNIDYQLTPAKVEQSIAIAKLIKYLWIDVYDKIIGVDFTRTYIPRIIHVIGSGAYNSNNTFLLGTAEGGMKITLFRVNDLDVKKLSAETLNEWYLKTMHHEFAHILHQTKNYPENFAKISNDEYIANEWSSVSQTLAIALEKGFMTRYSRKNANEDFVEIFAMYLTTTPTVWLETIESMGESKNIFLQKFDIVYAYFKNVWKVDMNDLRKEVLERTELISELDLENL